jgi:hypothetical protein
LGGVGFGGDAAGLPGAPGRYPALPAGGGGADARPGFGLVPALRTLAARLAGTSQFESLPARPVDRLLLEAQALEDAFYHQGLLDPAEWRALSEKFERCGRHFRAEYMLEKLGRLEGMRDSRQPIAAGD